MSKIRVAVFPADAVNATEVHDALSSCVNIEVWGLSSVKRHGPYVFRNYRSDLPMANDPGFYDALESVVEELGIDVIVPTHDTVLLELAKNRERLSARVMAPCARTAELCRSKRLTYEALSGEPFIPKNYCSASEVLSFPVFAKPDKGQGAVGASVVRSAKELSSVDFSESVVTEYLPGREFTVDCLTDVDGNLVVVSPRERVRIWAGISAEARIVPLTEEVRRIAETINEKVKFQGLWFFQVKEDSAGRMKLMEVSARCAGTMCATRALGYNLPLMSVYTTMGVRVSALRGGYGVVVDRELESRYALSLDYDAVFIDYDDTVVFGDDVNPSAIRFLYQCRRNGIPVTLLTRHEGDLTESLESHAISSNLFARIEHLAGGEPKAGYIDPTTKPIFIDNAFAERAEVSKGLGIPVFDVSEIPMLIDMRS